MTKAVRYPDNVKHCAQQMRSRGLSYDKIATRFGCCRASVVKWCDPKFRAERNAYRVRLTRHKRKTNAAFSKRERTQETERRRIYRSTLKGRCESALKSSAHQAKKLGHKGCTATAEEIAAALVKQGYCCAITGLHESELSKRLCMDHDHETGKFRGWICHTINRVIGMAKESPEILISAACYLSEHNND